MIFVWTNVYIVEIEMEKISDPKDSLLLHKNKYLQRSFTNFYLLTLSLRSSSREFPYLMRFWLILRLRMEWIRIEFDPFFSARSTLCISHSSRRRLFVALVHFVFHERVSSLNECQRTATSSSLIPTTSNAATHQHSFKLGTNSRRFESQCREEEECWMWIGYSLPLLTKLEQR